MTGKIKLNSVNGIMNLIDCKIENTESLNKTEEEMNISEHDSESDKDETICENSSNDQNNLITNNKENVNLLKIQMLI